MKYGRGVFSEDKDSVKILKENQDEKVQELAKMD